MVLLALWLAWMGLGILTKRIEMPPPVVKQAIALAAMLAGAAGVWFGFGLSDKLEFDEPRFLLLALAALPFFVLGAWSLQQLEPPRRWSAVYLRLMLLFLATVLLAGFRTVQQHDELTVVALIDTSESVQRFARAPGGATDESGQPLSVRDWAQRHILAAAAGGRQGDAFGAQVFDGRPTVINAPSRGTPSFSDAVVEAPFEGTNAQRAIESGMASKQSADSALRLLLASDGNFTEGNVMEAARAAAAAGIPIDVLPLEYSIENEVMVEGVYVPSEAREGQTVPIEVVLRGTAPVAGYIQLRHRVGPNNQLVDLNGPDTPGTGRRITADRWRRVNRDAEEGGDTGFGDYILRTYIDRPMYEAGVHRYEVVFEPAVTDGSVNTVVANDKAEAFTLVAGRGAVLVVDGVGGTPGDILPDAIASHGVVVRTVPPEGMPRRLTDMQAYDSIIFQNVPAEAVPPFVQQNLARYVHDFGGGFMMVGGPDSFGPGGWTNTDIDKYILPVACQIPSQVQLPSGALVLVIDRSGSMFSDVAGSGLSQQNVASEAAVLALSTLYPQDLVGVVAFDTSAHWLVKLGLNDNPSETAQRVRSMQPGGGTDINAGVQAAVAALSNITTADAAVKHIIVITDGHGAMPNMLTLGRTLGQQGITISTVGVGDGHDAGNLHNLAQTGNGQFYPVVDPNNLPQVFIKEARLIRKNLIRELLFTPGLRSTGSPIMTGVSAVPPLQGFVLTGPKRDPRIFMPLTGPEGEPIFAHHQVGLGRAAAFTADAHNRWGVHWLDWAGYADFWGRTIRQISRPPASLEADLSTRIDGDTLVLQLDAAGDLEFDAPAGTQGASFGNDLDVRGAITRPDGSVSTVRLAQVGPGLYEARVPAHEAGSYIADLVMTGRDGGRRRVIGGTSNQAGGELRTFTSNRAVLQEIADLTGGRVLDPADPTAAMLFDRDADNPFESVSTRPLGTRHLMPFILLLLLMDVACRRIAWDAREIGGWAKGRLNTVAGTMKSRKVEGASTMAALKAKRAQTSAQLNQPQAVPERSEGADQAPGLGGLASRVKQNAQQSVEGKPAKQPKPKPAASRTRKFVASEEDLAKAKDSFTAAVGGAKEGVEAKPIITAAQRKSEKDQGPTTSRLLDAKRRAQEKLKDKED
ncbi:MAG: VWA domain-containing protein [Planctomycetota bacterium]